MNTATTTAGRTHDYKEIKEPRMVRGIHQRRAIWSRVRPSAADHRARQREGQANYSVRLHG